MAYENQPVGIGKGQTISQPYTVAFQTQLLEMEKRMRVLEIGTGSGYQAAILGALGARVFYSGAAGGVIFKNKKITGYENVREYPLLFSGRH